MLFVGCAAAMALLALASPARATTLSQNNTNTITSGNSVACETAGPAHRENSYYRRFELGADHGITTSFTISSVIFGIETANDGGGLGQPVTVRLFSIDSGDSFTLANLTLLASQGITVLDSETGTLRTVAVSGTVGDPTTTDLVVEVFTPDGMAAGNYFLIGSNTSGQTHPGYIRAPDCGAAEPATTANLGAPNMHIVVFVDGNEAQPPMPPPAPAPPESSQPSNDFSFGVVELNKNKGTATLPVAVPGPGTLVLTGKGIVKQRQTAQRGPCNSIRR